MFLTTILVKIISGETSLKFTRPCYADEGYFSISKMPIKDLRFYQLIDKNMSKVESCRFPSLTLEDIQAEDWIIL